MEKELTTMPTKKEKEIMKKKQCEEKVYRQGDLIFRAVRSLPKLAEAKTNVLLKNGSSGNPHTFSGGKFYPKIEGNFIIGFLRAGKDCKVFHAEHGDKDDVLRSGNLPAGHYEVRRQSEETINGLKQVID